jgi:acyl-CoA reductase-like NAD-dependent aldehyde dehydrogenase
MRILEKFDRRSRTILIDGEFRKSEATDGRDVIDAATEDVVAEIAEATATEVDTAVDSVHAAPR